MLELGIACAALVLAAVAVGRAYVPPQQQRVRELLVRVAELENDYGNLADRLTVRQRKEGMEKARDAHEQRRQRRDAIESEAAELIAAARQQPQQQFDFSTEAGRAAAKAALRRAAPWTDHAKAKH